MERVSGWDATGDNLTLAPCTLPAKYAGKTIRDGNVVNKQTCYIAAALLKAYRDKTVAWHSAVRPMAFAAKCAKAHYLGLFSKSLSRADRSKRLKILRAAKYNLVSVWNADLDRYINDPVTLKSIKWIVVGDNPGSEERTAGVYFAANGTSGGEVRLMFFRELGLAYRDEVLLLNKTPLWSRSVNELKGLSKRQQVVLRNSQIEFARLVCRLHELTNAKVWVLGLGDCYKRDNWKLPSVGAAIAGEGGVMAPFFSYVRKFYTKDRPDLAFNLFVSKHTSHGHFFSEVSADYVITAGLEQSIGQLPYRTKLTLRRRPR